MISSHRFTVLAGCLLAIIARADVTYDTSKHGHPETGVQRLADQPPGACGQCHDGHASRNGVPNSGPFNRTLFTADDVTLCYECHSVPGASQVYPGNVTWAESTHAVSAEMFWPGPVPPARNATDSGKCVNCHDPHGASDASGVIPSMNRLREEALCYGCHDGTPAPDVKAQFAKAYRHPIASAERHEAVEGLDEDAARYAASPVDRRHAECADCHNSHVARADLGAPTAPEASQRLAGVARVSVVNGAAGTEPLYVWRGAQDGAFVMNEYEICFKCHSSWTQLGAGQTDLATLTNPGNASYHPVQAAGKNTNIDVAAFVQGWSSQSLVYCSDCHGSDDSTIRGPHGSAYRYILKRHSPSTSTPQPVAQADLCFSCHRFETYGDASASPANQGPSRFNLPSSRGHAYHVGEQQVPCYACHVTHGSATKPALIATGRTPGIVFYMQTTGGGTCTPTCHMARSYTVNYAR